MRLRQHVNPLKLEFLVPRTRAVDLPAGREVEVELGCAEAQFLFERAAQGRASGVSRTYVGLEIRKELVDAVNEKAVALGVDVRAVFTNVNVDMPFLFRDGSVARVFLNFPDPWFKRKQQKRRVVDEELVRQLHRILVPEGELFFQSDVWDLALDAMAVIEGEAARFENRAGPWSFWKKGNPYGVRSRREEQCERDGVPIWRMLYRRRP